MIVQGGMTGRCEYCAEEWGTTVTTAVQRCVHVRFKRLALGRWEVTYDPLGGGVVSALRCDFRNRLHIKRLGIKVW